MNGKPEPVPMEDEEQVTYEEEDIPTISSLQEKMELYDNNIEAIDRYVEMAKTFQKQQKPESARRILREAYNVAEETGDLARQSVISIAKQMGMPLDLK